MASLVLILTGCPGAGKRVYSLDVDHQILRRHEDSIGFGDPRLRCLELEDGRECRFVCMAVEDILQ